MPQHLTLRAPAKVNFSLEILGKRCDGYHELRSVVVPVSLYDVVRVERASEGIVTYVENGTLPPGNLINGLRSEENLATMAAIALKQKAGYEGGATITLAKQIPIGGGLGGGSSDAAAVLKGLNRLWETHVPEECLLEIGAKLGCDVPCMVYGRAVFMEGVGERITPLEITEEHARKGWWLVLANAGIEVSTRDIYARHRTSLTSGRGGFTSMVSALRTGDPEEAATSLFNALEPTVFRKYPFIEILVEKLRNGGALGALLCGSGGTVFGIARDYDHACEVEDSLIKSAGLPIWTRVVKTLPDGVMVAHGPLEA